MIGPWNCTLHRRAARLALGCLVTVIWVSLTAPVHADNGDYPLGTGDRLRIAVHGQPELTSEVQVRPPGVISLSFLGPLSVVGLTPGELELAIAERLGRKTGPGGCCVSVEVTQFRPFFVVGDVRSSGSYPWVPGMTVLHALAIAGGMGTSTEGWNVSARAEIARARERLRVLLDGLGVSLARRARLEAERDDLRQISFPDELADTLDSERLEITQSGERSLLEERRRVLNTEINSLVDGKKVFEEEINAHLAQIEAERKKAALLAEELKELSGIHGRLVPKTLLLNLQRQSVQTEADIRELQSFIARARQQMVQIDQAVLKLRNIRRIDVIAGLKQVEDDIESGRNGIEETRRFLAATGSMEAALAAQPRRIDDEFVTLVRMTPRGPQELVATEFTRVMPGDLVRVPLQARLDGSIAIVNEEEARLTPVAPSPRIKGRAP